MTQQTIVAVYDTPAHAEMAVHDMLAAGVPESAIERHAQDGTYTGISTATTSRPAEHEGFWASLFGGEHDHDATVYDRSACRAARPSCRSRLGEDSRAHRHATSWRSTIRSTSTSAPVQLRADADHDRAHAAGRRSPHRSRSRTPRPRKAGSSSYRKSLWRSANASSITARRASAASSSRHPVEEQVTLHDERVTLERRPVTDGRAVPTGAFTDKSIEMTETAEEAVVSKTARVVEEIDLKKTATDRVETVRDTVRREDVEVVKVPGDETLRSHPRSPLV